MKRIPYIFAALLVLTVAGLSAQSASKHGTIKEVTLSRGMCFGSCPSYDLTLRADGTAVFEGKQFAPRKGKYIGHFWGESLNKFGAAAERNGFWSLKSHYSVGYTDQATQTLTIKTDKGKTVVSEYGPSGPAELWELQTIVDGIAANISDWKKISG